MRRRILVTASAMILATQLGGAASADEPTTEELGTISNYLETNDVEGLRGYLAEHPDLAEGDTPLAELLRRFMVESVRGNEYFRFRNRNDETSDTEDDTGSPASAGPPGVAY